MSAELAGIIKNVSNICKPVANFRPSNWKISSYTRCTLTLQLCAQQWFIFSCLEFGPNNSKVVLRPGKGFVPKVFVMSWWCCFHSLADRDRSIHFHGEEPDQRYFGEVSKIFLLIELQYILVQYVVVLFGLVVKYSCVSKNSSKSSWNEEAGMMLEASRCQELFLICHQSLRLLDCWHEQVILK